jgi:hypothetical protein
VLSGRTGRSDAKPSSNCGPVALTPCLTNRGRRATGTAAESAGTRHGVGREKICLSMTYINSRIISYIMADFIPSNDGAPKTWCANFKTNQRFANTTSAA